MVKGLIIFIYIKVYILLMFKIDYIINFVLIFFGKIYVCNVKLLLRGKYVCIDDILMIIFVSSLDNSMYNLGLI